MQDEDFKDYLYLKKSYVWHIYLCIGCGKRTRKWSIKWAKPLYCPKCDKGQHWARTHKEYRRKKARQRHKLTYIPKKRQGSYYKLATGL